MEQFGDYYYSSFILLFPLFPLFITFIIMGDTNTHKKIETGFNFRSWGSSVVILTIAT